MDRNQEREFRRAFVDAAAQAEAESGGRTPAVAVTLGSEGEAEGGKEHMPSAGVSQDELEAVVRRLQAWEARLAERAQAVAAAEADVVGRAQEVANVIEQLEHRTVSADEYAAGSRTAGADRREGRERMGLIDAVRAEAFALAQDRDQLEQVLAQMIEDYGREHVVVTLALASPMVELLAEPYVSGVNQQIEALIDGVRDAFSRNHLAAIADAHADYEEVTGSEAFLNWLAALDEADQAVALDVLQNGSAGRVVKLLGIFKQDIQRASTADGEAEDGWAVDAAAGVKGSAPLRLPEQTGRGGRYAQGRSGRGEVSPQDEYALAWEAL